MEVDLLNLFIKRSDNMKLGGTPRALEDRLRICKVLDNPQGKRGTVQEKFLV